MGGFLVGDAACFVDPLFSSGVHLAMMSAVMAAAYLDASRNDPFYGRPSGPRVPGVVPHGIQPLQGTGSPVSTRVTGPWSRTSGRVVEFLEGSEDEQARKSFIRAVAGQSARGYERAVLERGALPIEFRTSVSTLESERRAKASSFNTSAVLDVVPVLAERFRHRAETHLRGWHVPMERRAHRFAAS